MNKIPIPCRVWMIAAAMLAVAPPLYAFDFPLLHSSNTRDIRSFLEANRGSSNAKIVFVNTTTAKDGQLCYIDLSEENDTPLVHKITKVKNAKVPVISPDGKWVAYVTGSGGEAGKGVTLRSSAYICRIAEDAAPVQIYKDSAAEPRFMMDTKPGTDTIVFSTLSPIYGWEGFGATMKIGITYDGDVPAVGTAQPLLSHGSFTGGLSYDKRYLCGGGGTAAMFDFEGDGKADTITNFGQACNASITSSRTDCDRAMYITMAGSDASIDNNTSWGQWQIIFISDIDKNIIRYYKRPLTFTFDPQTYPAQTIEYPGSALCWHHPEWSNHPCFATATLNIKRSFTIVEQGDTSIENTFYQERLYLIDLKSGKYCEVLRPHSYALRYNPDSLNSGAGIYWPWLWVEIPEDFEEETIGVRQPCPGRASATHNPPLLAGTKLSAATPIVGIAAFDLSGKRISLLPRSRIAGMQADITPLLAENAAGIRLIRITCTGEEYTVPLINK